VTGRSWLDAIISLAAAMLLSWLALVITLAIRRPKRRSPERVAGTFSLTLSDCATTDHQSKPPDRSTRPSRLLFVSLAIPIDVIPDLLGSTDLLVGEQRRFVDAMPSCGLATH
jgi:hypothetical protein